MRVILDSHPHICCGPESGLFLAEPIDDHRLADIAKRFDLEPESAKRLRRASRSQAEFIDAFFRHYCAEAGKRRWAEKTPRNVHVLDFVFEHFPAARFVHVIRDGRDTVCSLRTHPRHQIVDGKLVPLNTWRPIELCTRRWVRDVQAGLKYRDHPAYLEVRYEELVNSPEPTLRRVFDLLGEPWTDRTLEFSAIGGSSRDALKFPQNPEATRPIYQSAVGRWQTELSSDDAVVFKRLAGPLLVELGYAEDDAWEPDSSEAPV